MSHASVRKVRFIPEAPYLGGLSGAFELISVAPLAKHRARKSSGPFSRSWDTAGTSDTFEVLAAEIPETFEDLASQKYRELSRSYHRQHL